jgi:hypothetical protein
MWYYQNMSKSRSVLPKPNKGGRPATGRDPVRAIRLSDEFLAEVDAWADRQDDQPGRSEAIRRLVELGLTVRTKSKQPPVERATRAKELASKAIDKVADQSASQEERIQRRRRLTKGPHEFREDRVDLSETKRRK